MPPERVSVIDFDRGRLRAPGAWTLEESGKLAPLAAKDRRRAAARSIHAGSLGGNCWLDIGRILKPCASSTPC